MKMIAAVSKDWGIGMKNGLLFSIPADMKFFRETTKDNVVIMGRKTLESFPGGKPLKNRINIVLTSDKSYETDAIVCNTKDEAVRAAAKYKDKDVFIIGGASIYNLFEDMCDTAYITKVRASAPCDIYLKNLDSDKNWIMSEESEIKKDNGYEFTFCKYVK